MRFPLLLASAAMLTVTASGEEPRPVLRERAEMRATPVLLDASDPAHVRVGALTYLGGVRLTSPDPAFGGFSSMRIVGDRVTLLSDAGNLVQFTLGRDWQPRDMRFGDLPGGPGSGWAKWQRDSESLATDPATGTVWVGFESYNAIWRYDRDFRRAERHVQPRAMRKWSEAGGPESMVRLRDGRFVVIGETSRPKGFPQARELLVFDRDPTETRTPPQLFGYVPPAKYDPSDAVELPDGRLLILNRRLSVPGLFTAKLTVLDLRRARPRTLVRGTEIATLESPLIHDNYEALAITHEDAETILWIASDDNQEIWEQSLLLKFRLDL
jgi:hypothetical protein